MHAPTLPVMELPVSTSTTASPRRQSRRLWTALLALAAVLATASGATGWHITTCEEDSCVIFVCSVQGNRVCGPDTPPIIIGRP